MYLSEQYNCEVPVVYVNKIKVFKIYPKSQTPSFSFTLKRACNMNYTHISVANDNCTVLEYVFTAI